jgi:alpha-2-macroglobulin-like protein
MDAYTLAVLANFAVDSGDREFERQAVELLLGARKESGDQAWWETPETGVYATGLSAAIETTGLAAQALLKSGQALLNSAQAGATAKKALTYIASKKNAAGSWGTTQATIMALRALLLSTSKGAADVQGAVEISLNGKPVKKLMLTPENNDLYHEFALPNVDSRGPNLVEVKFEGKGSLAYQIAGSYFLPWTETPAQDPLSIDVSYDRTRLSQDDIATTKVTIKNNLSKTANMVMVDLGIPPGFDLLGEDFELYQEKSAGLKSGRLEKVSLTPTQAILYFDSIAPGEPVTLRYRLRAKYPVRARTFPSEVYEYYTPEVRSTARPVELEVQTRP